MRSRRAVLRELVGFGAAGAIGNFDWLIRLAAQNGCVPPPARGELVGLVPLTGERRYQTPFDAIIGEGLDARQFTDLSRVAPDRLITPASEVFIRTAAPKPPRDTSRWSIRLGSQETAAHLAVDEIVRQAKPMGAHLIECSGNNDPHNFGLMSVAEWDGVPLRALLPRLGATGDHTALVVSGVDDAPIRARTSIPGAAWVVPLARVHATGGSEPFLAVRMNGQPLTPDHGAPVRLVVPGWYGCSWIKWVDELRLAGRDEPTTSQMREFAVRTHQSGIPQLARDYALPVIDVAATPIRVEKRRVDGKLEYRIVGLVWGGERPIDQLQIRFGATDTFKPFTICPRPTTHRRWSLWEYLWHPPSAGSYTIALKAADPSIRTRRLDISFYVRRVSIDEV